MARHFCDLTSVVLGARGNLNQLTWWLRDPAGARQVTGIVVGDCFSDCAGRLGESARLDERGEQHGMMHDFIIAPELRIIVLEAVETVRAVGDDFSNRMFSENFDVFFGKFLKDKFVPHPSSRFARAPFLGPKHGKPNVRLRQEPDHAAGDPLHAAVV